MSIRQRILCAILLLLLAGCSSLNGTRLEPWLGGDVNLTSLGDSIARRLIEQALPPLFARLPEQPVLVTTPVDNNHLDATSDFGRNLQNSLITGFVQRGYAVKELKLRSNLLVQEEGGEFMLTRRLKEMAVQQKAQAVVVTTYALTNRMLYLSVRMVDPANTTIRAAVEERLYLDANTLRMLGFQLQPDEGDETITPPKESILDRLLY